MPIRREYPEQPLVGVGAIIIEGERIVLVKRGNPPLAGAWSIPGGVLEIGETLRMAAAREAFEETSLRVEPAELLGVYDRLQHDHDGRTLYHYVLIDFLCKRLEGTPHAAGDAIEARWFSRAELNQLKLAADTVDVIKKAFLRARP